MASGLVWEPIAPDGVREFVAAAAGSVVTVTAGDQRCIGTLGLALDHLTFELAERTFGANVRSELCRIEFDLDRYAIRLWARLDEASSSGWVLYWPEHAERRDRRRFRRVGASDERCTLALADQHPPQAVDLVDVSVNGCSFHCPPARRFLRGQRVPALVTLGGGLPAAILLEVLAVGSIVRGRFLAPEDGSELDLVTLGATPGMLDELNRILAAVAADATPAGMLRAFAPSVRREPE